jgi:hypothetical protein
MKKAIIPNSLWAIRLNSVSNPLAEMKKLKKEKRLNLERKN